MHSFSGFIEECERNVAPPPPQSPPLQNSGGACASPASPFRHVCFHKKKLWIEWLRSIARMNYFHGCKFNLIPHFFSFGHLV